MKHLVDLNNVKVINNLEIVEKRQNTVRFHVIKDPFIGMLNEKCTIIYIFILNN
jgi:hypothetical protein